MKLICATLVSMSFIAGAVFLCKDNHWFTGCLSLLAAVAVRAKSEAIQ